MKAPKKGIKWEKLGFGFSDVNCHLRMTWKDGKWSKPKFVKDPWIKMHIGAACLHYGQECFEGIKAFRQKSGKIVIFRPDENAKRMYRTAERTCMPPIPVKTFIECCRAVVKKNAEYVPPFGTGGSMYLRPLLIGTGPQIGVAPAKEYTFMIMVMPVGAYYKGGIKPVRAVIFDQWDRAAPHGMGDVKVGGNYAAGIFAHEKGRRKAGRSSSTSTPRPTSTSRSSQPPTSPASPRTARMSRQTPARCSPRSPICRSASARRTSASRSRCARCPTPR